MRVENFAHHRLGAGFASALLVIDQIGLHHPDPQRFTGRRGVQGQRKKAIGGDHARYQRGENHRLADLAPSTGAARPSQRKPFIRQQQQHRQPGAAAEVGKLAHDGRRVEPITQGVAQDLGQRPFGAHPRGGRGQRTHGGAMPFPGQVADQGKSQELRLKDGRKQQQNRQADGAPDPRVVADGQAEPPERRRRERHRHEPCAHQRARQCWAGVHRAKPWHQHDQAQHPGVAAVHVDGRQHPAQGDTGQHAPARAPERGHGQHEANSARRRVAESRCAGWASRGARVPGGPRGSLAFPLVSAGRRAVGIPAQTSESPRCVARRR
jgi:hypothetical protein